MTAAARKGWCPSLFAPMESGDGLIVRIKPTAAMIETGVARALAGASRSYGSGIIELTNRGNLQLRGLRPETVAPVAALAAKLRLAASDPALERIRNVMASPLGADDPAAAFDSHALAADIERMIAAEPRLAVLPPKFGFLVDGGGVLPLDAVSADIMLRPSDAGVLIELPFGEAAVECSRGEAVSAARRLALAFIDLSGGAAAPVHRMRDLVQAAGAKAVFESAGFEASAAARTPRPAPRAIGPVAMPQAAGNAFGVGLPFGQVDSAGFAILADLAERYGDGSLRMTPWRGVVISGVAPHDAAGLAAEAARAGLIVDPGDRRLSIAACPGSSACRNASVETRRDAARLAAQGRLAGLLVHVSGCSKGCAHPETADATLVGSLGRYGVVLGGTAKDRPAAADLTIDAAIAFVERHRSGSTR